MMVNNADWLDQLDYIDFLRDYGRHFSVNRMLTYDSVKLRLEREQPLSFIEFNYMVLQAYDFVELYRRHRLPPADGRLRSMGQYRQRHRAWPPHRRHRAVRADLTAAHDGLRRQDGQDGRRRGVAQPRHAVALRLLAILAEQRGCATCRRFLKLFTELPLDRDRQARQAQRRRAERGEEGARHRSDCSACMGATRPTARQRRRAPRSSKARSSRACPRSSCREPSSSKDWACSAPTCWSGFVSVDRRGKAPDQGRRHQGE